MQASRPRYFLVFALTALVMALAAGWAWGKHAPTPAGQAPATPFRTEEPLFQGLWVDPRTGGDFLQLERRGKTWLVTTYGGDPARPRYMSKGVLDTDPSGDLTGQVKDLPGQCCGNQGRISLRLDQGDRLQMRAFWWPLGQADPGTELAPPYDLQRVRVSRAVPVAPPADPAPAPGQAAVAPAPDKGGKVSENWEGAWQGEGWGRFLMARRERTLYILWYYGQPEGPKFHGRYQLSNDMRQAKGQAYGPVAASPTYFRHELEMEPSGKNPPTAKLASWRLAAPLDDGRLVSFKQPKQSGASLRKVSDALTADEAALLKQFMDSPDQDPVKRHEQALDRASRAGRLVKR